MRTYLAAALLVASVLRVGVAHAENTYVRIEPMRRQRDKETTWHTDYGSFRRNYSERRGVTVLVRNNNQEACTYSLAWYFIAETLDGKGRWIFDWGSETVTLEPTEEKSISKQSAEITGEDTKYAALGERHREGGKYDGWFVIVRRGDDTIKTASSKGSSRQYEKTVIEMIRKLSEKTPGNTDAQ